MESIEYVTGAEICQAFLEHAASFPAGELNYGDFASLLLERGTRIRGATPKRQRDAVWRALVADSRIERSGPGMFRVAAMM